MPYIYVYSFTPRMARLYDKTLIELIKVITNDRAGQKNTSNVWL